MNFGFWPRTASGPRPFEVLGLELLGPDFGLIIGVPRGSSGFLGLDMNLDFSLGQPRAQYELWILASASLGPEAIRGSSYILASESSGTIV